MLKYILLSTFYFLVSFNSAEAAEIYFGTHAQEAGINQYVEVGVFLNTGGENVNAVEGTIIFPQSILEFRGIVDGNSILNLWVERPYLQAEEEVRFSGILPGGYEGSQGYLFSMVFLAKGQGQATIETRDEKVLLHDGAGTATRIVQAPLGLRILEESASEDFLTPYDPDAPELFTPQIAQDPNLFGGKWFLVFVTQDKGTGIDHYEVREQRRWKIFTFELGIWPAKWVTAQSPYVLADQALKSFVYVKAQDRARNERVVTLSPSYPLRWYEISFLWVIIGIAILVGVFGSILWRKKQQKE